MTFDDEGTPELSPNLSEHARTELRSNSPIPLTDAHRRRLAHHRERARRGRLEARAYADLISQIARDASLAAVNALCYRQ